MAYALAARHPDAVREAIAFAGTLPHALYPTSKPAPLYAIHGEDDEVIPFALGADTAKAFKAAGGTISFHPVEGLGHSYGTQVQHLVWAELKSLGEGQGPGPGEPN